MVGVQQKGLIGAAGAAFNETLKTNLYDLQSNGLPAASKDKYASATAHMTGDLSDSHVTAIKNKLNIFTICIHIEIKPVRS